MKNVSFKKSAIADKKSAIADFNKIVGSRVRAVRNSRGLKQTELAQRVGVQSPQIHKFERGSQRISAGMLYAISKALDVDVSQFYIDIKTVDSKPI